MKTYNTDLLIVGAGPVGIFSIYQAGFLGMKTIVVDALSEIGGQLNALYPNKYIYDIPAYDKILAKDLISELLKQANPFISNGMSEILLNRQVTDLVRNENDSSFCIKTSENDTIYAKAIIVCAGAGAFGPNRPPLENIDKYEGTCVHYFIKDPDFFKDQNVLVAGGGDSAVDWAVALGGIANKVYVIHRRDNFRAAPVTVQQMRDLAKENKIEILTPYMLDGLKGSGNKLSHVIIKDFQDNRKELEVDHLLPFFGLSRNLGDLEKWGFELNKLHSTITVHPPTYESNIPGIFATGDVSHYDHKLKIISLGFAESVMAIHASWQYVFPEKRFRFVHSTSK